jgi:hypothetical protein
LKAGPLALALILLAGCEEVADVDGAAEAGLMAARGSLWLAVYPTILRRDSIGYDAAEARRLASGLEAAGLARITPLGDRVHLTPEWEPNQAAMWNRSLGELRAWLSLHPAGADYVLLVECLLQPSDVLAGVNVYLLDRQGRLALRRFYDTHRQEFAAVSRRGPTGCTDLTLQTLGRALAPVQVR